MNFESYSDYPQVVQENAQRALNWAEENGWGSCGTPVGKARANQLAKGEPISRETIARMSAFSRHLQYNDKELGDGCAKLMILAWGGKEGIEWAERKLKQIDSELKGQTSSVSDATWSTTAPISISFAKVSFDYDETLTTEKGMEMAKRAIERGDEVYIISARRDREGMLARAKELGIPTNRVIATGSNKEKVRKVKELGIRKHIDNNSDVVASLPSIGQKFKSHKRVLVDEDFDIDLVSDYKKRGFSVFVRSKRKIKRNDGKLWNKLRKANLSEDNILYGEVIDLHKKYEFNLLLTGQDPLSEAFKVLGQDHFPKKILHEEAVFSIEDAEIKMQAAIKNIDLKFVSVVSKYKYEEIPGIPAAKSGSRDFCRERLSTPNRYYTLEEIRALPNDLAEMFSQYGIQPDPFLYRGGFYRYPGSTNTTPWCRHQWSLKIFIE